MSNLLKEAIADAKAVRQTALANAKISLMEQFTEKYSKMFADKLKEEADQGNEFDNVDNIDNVSGGVSEQEIDELIKELESEVGDDNLENPTNPELGGNIPSSTPSPVGSTPSPVSTPPAAPVPPTGCPPCPVGSDSALNPQGMAPGVPQGPVAGEIPPAPTVPPVPPAPSSAPNASAPVAPGQSVDGQLTPPTSDVPVEDDEIDEDINLDELLQTLKEELENDDDCEEDETIDEQTKLTSSGIGGNKAGGSANKAPASGAKSSSKVESGNAKNEGVPSPDSTKVGPNDATEASRPNQGKNATSSNQSTPSCGGKSGPAVKASRPNGDGSIDGTSKLHEENENLKRQLNEAHEAIKYVKTQLNEINLLNAKLLYTNKLFKEFNMNNEQKMRVVEMFDLSKNVREVKLTYANIAESLNFSGTDVKRKVRVSNAQSITEGLASQPVGGTKPSKQLISEGKATQMVTRFQQIAGIKSTKK